MARKTISTKLQLEGHEEYVSHIQEVHAEYKKLLSTLAEVNEMLESIAKHHSVTQPPPQSQPCISGK